MTVCRGAIVCRPPCVAIHRNAQHIFAKQLLCNVNKAGIVGQGGDEG